MISSMDFMLLKLSTKKDKSLELVGNSEMPSNFLNFFGIAVMICTH